MCSSDLEISRDDIMSTQRKCRPYPGTIDHGTNFSVVLNRQTLCVTPWNDVVRSFARYVTCNLYIFGGTRKSVISNSPPHDFRLTGYICETEDKGTESSQNNNKQVERIDFVKNCNFEPAFHAFAPCISQVKAPAQISDFSPSLALFCSVTLRSTRIL